MKVISLQFILLSSLFFLGSLVNSYPLSTNGRWVIDTKTGNRVKFHCVNWASHMQPMVVEGLDKKPLQHIINSISSLGFNCVRLTWSTYMFTKNDNANLTVGQSFESLKLTEAKNGIAKNNPSLLNLRVIEAYELVVDELGKEGIMVVVDNHVSKPQWCCDNNDGNGFFGDKYFDPNEWLLGLSTVAKRFIGKSQVVGMSMRNELRGPRQSVADWYQYVTQGAAQIHKDNPNVIISGLNYDTDLSFLKNRNLSVNLEDKLVFEGHWYSFSAGREKNWELQPGRECETTMSEVDSRFGFVVEDKNPVPLFLSEFGADQRGTNSADNQYLTCFLAYAATKDLDWALWALQGSYYIRDTNVGIEETYGVLDANWNQPRNPNFKDKYSLIREMLIDPKSSLPTNYILYHPLSGRCALVDNNHNIQLNGCQKRSHWSYGGDGTQIKLMGTSMCLKVVNDGTSVSVSRDCNSKQSIWSLVSSSKLRIGTTDEQGKSLCLENNPTNDSSSLLTKECLCLSDDSYCHVNPGNQWFKLIPTNFLY